MFFTQHRLSQVPTISLVSPQHCFLPSGNKTLICFIITQNLLFLRISLVVFMSHIQVLQYHHSKVISHRWLSFPADQRARHHHGRGAGVRHPAQHDRKTAVWPGKRDTVPLCRTEMLIIHFFSVTSATQWKNDCLLSRTNEKQREECQCQWVLGWVWVWPGSVWAGRTVCSLFKGRAQYECRQGGPLHVCQGG